MNVEANVASENWEELFSAIQEQCRDGGFHVNLTDCKADRYDFSNEILMRGMLERLVETLQEVTPMVPPGDLTFGNKFFMLMDEEQQRSFFHSIFNLRVWYIRVGEATDNSMEGPEISISTSALLETLPQLHISVRHLAVNNFALTRQSDVQALSNIIGSKCETLRVLKLESIKRPVDVCNKQDSDESDGFLDPLFYTAFGLDAFWVSTKIRSVHSTLVSTRALRALFLEGKQFRTLRLNDLGLNDSHVLAIVDGLSTPGSHLDWLNLESNPGITDHGYGALLNLINRANVIRGVALCHEYEPCVDEKAWEAKIRLVSEMNSQYGRLEYMTKGTFTSEECRLQWLEELADRIRREEFSDRGRKDYVGRKKERDAKHLNFVWYTLCQNAEMMKT